MSQQRQQNIEDLGAWWCNLMHDSPMWPIHGRYECATCGRHYAVPWDDRRNSRTRSHAALTLVAG